ncbi:MAG: threonylcarbamoyl-AMP synthase [Acidobacteria bacterium]|nr:threonylcarbamoyl-AMP synthase [Acidobacteriota bacterium]MBU1475618.1 threonylcarbamoyl-AMP synthase [Acidobacteriota bacterium]
MDIYSRLVYHVLMVKTRVVRTDRFMAGQMDEIAAVLRTGGVIVYPTDTFYGLGAGCYFERAIGKIYALKGREWKKPLSVVIADREMLETVTAFIPPGFSLLADEFWPGPLTVILDASPDLPKKLLGGGGRVAVRLPDFPWLRELIRTFGFPLTATSANLSGEEDISRPEDVRRIFDGRVDLIVDGGPTPGGRPSTVLDLTVNPPVVRREGAVPVQRLNTFLDTFLSSGFYAD